MTFDLGLAHNFSDLDLVARFNHIYPGHVTTGITISFPFRSELRLNILQCFGLQHGKKLLNLVETEEENQLDHLMKKTPNQIR